MNMEVTFEEFITAAYKNMMTQSNKTIYEYKTTIHITEHKIEVETLHEGKAYDFITLPVNGDVLLDIMFYEN
jgi:hypothetical protein